MNIRRDEGMTQVDEDERRDKRGQEVVGYPGAIREPLLSSALIAKLNNGDPR